MNEIASKGQLRMGFVRWAVVLVPLVLLLGFLSASIAPAGSASSWYMLLKKPALTPPDWLFPVAWTILYILMAVALALVATARGARGRGIAVALFVGQLIANLVWSPVFFAMHQIGWALVILIVMFVLALATTIAFWRIRRLAGVLLLPYLAWIVFAGVVLLQVHILNPDAAHLAPASASTQIAL